ncbi:MAG: hypothetical protein V4463_21600 [Pseudomonadota bacterium]
MKKILVLAGLVIAGQQCAFAETGYYLVSPYPIEGQATIDFKYWNAKPTGQPPRSEPELGVSYNVNSRWYTEVTAAWFKFSPGPARLVGYEWQNDFMLTQGQYPIDVAFHTNYFYNKNTARGVNFEFGPVLQTEIGRTQFNLNLFFSRDYKVAAPTEMELAYQWQVKYRWKHELEFGIQGFGEVGEWNHWDPSNERSFRAGPAVFGAIGAGQGHEIKYEAAYLIGTNSAHTAKSVALRLQYVF